MPKKYISIQEATDISKKSAQTIRRAIKAKKLKCRKQKTPQGFNYIINKESLCKFYKIKLTPDGETAEKSKKAQNPPAPKKIRIKGNDLESLTKTLEKIAAQHVEERQNFLRLINTLQEKIFILENQLNLLKSPAKRWYQFWK